MHAKSARFRAFLKVRRYMNLSVPEPRFSRRRRCQVTWHMTRVFLFSYSVARSLGLLQ